VCISATGSALTETLQAHGLRAALIDHPVFATMRDGEGSKAWVAQVLGQWWWPLHHFPTFLGRCVAILPDIESQCAIARILHQETGEGMPARAHERIYVDTMERAGFTRPQIAGAAAWPATAALLADYEAAARDRYEALGCLAATEFADLAMVSGIGAAVTRATGCRELEWVRIHETQEPDHVEEADHALLGSFGAEEGARIVAAAERSWRAWIGFFDALAEAAEADSRGLSEVA
jgi:pyrroloquinoline quinone (PQQ) biosynthesis protein C